ncbi:hypothetical protein GH741_08020 [Aquibacillus halophilus]|uniref:GK1464-like domain-containing protein n=1 Tax=Aquibacillus halophilus TaxID=930132 RepID=A0A6A8DBE9_9BACI|nr:DUF5634 family protein [Aquibacillus halophilus]MRH42630.1 hypothetical protein [Aquibacillus halophilus]
MEYIPRQQILGEIQNNFQTILETYDIDEVGIFEEEGQDNNYYMGYTITKDDKAFLIHQTFKKNDEGNMAPVLQEWTVESDEPNDEDRSGFGSLDEIFNKIFN